MSINWAQGIFLTKKGESDELFISFKRFKPQRLYVF